MAITPIYLVVESDFKKWKEKQSAFIKNWLSASGYKGEAGNLSLIPDKDGRLAKVIFCINHENNFWSVGNLPNLLPPGKYELQQVKDPLFFMAWGLGAYQFSRYRKDSRITAQLEIPSAQQKMVTSLVSSLCMVRDLINTPTEEMGPTEFSKIAVALAKKSGMKVKQVIGKDLLKKNYPLIHAVGRASDDQPRLLDLRWGNKKNPLVTLVGKGICFDSGGLDIKPAAGMVLMKKDMGGAAHVLGLARMIVDAKLAINLRVLIPLAENVISGNAFKPGDVIKSRKGISVEIGNTDGEGRLVLADAITEAVSENPDLLIDIATLTGAARVALGTELPAVFCNQDKLADSVIKQANQEQDYIWRLPLFALYRDSISSPIADISNNSVDGYGGAITAALFLKEFVPDNIPWLHFDLMAWNLKSRPGRPQGGEAMGLRGLLSYLKNRYQ